MVLGRIPADGKDELIRKIFDEEIPNFLNKLEPFCAGPGKFLFGN